jgi:hypothetical protein
VTGDADLLVLRSYADIGIVSPRQFLAWLEQSRGGCSTSSTSLDLVFLVGAALEHRGEQLAVVAEFLLQSDLRRVVA